MQIDCRGTGLPTVVFETGLDAGGLLSWSPVHDQVAAMTRACAYSRVGILASDAANDERDAHAVAADLHTLLERAGERAPLVLIAHSLGGIYAMAYTRQYGPDVAGLVLIDTLPPDTVQRNPVGNLVLQGMRRSFAIQSVLSRTGILRALVGGADDEAAYLPTTVSAMDRELDALDRNLAEASAARDLGNRPLFVLASGKLSPEFLADTGLTADQCTQFQDAKRALNEEQATWSTHSRYELVADAAHRIQDEKPDRVVAATRWVIDAVRAGLGQ